MNRVKMRNIYLVIVGILVVLIVIFAVFFAKNSGNTGDNGITVKENGTSDGNITITDINDGDITIPNYTKAAKNNYNVENFKTEDKGIISYSGAKLGINVSSQTGDIDWAKVKSSGVSFAMIRVGYRGYTNGKTYIDDKFQENIKGAKDAGIDVGVYYYSQATSVDEAETEAGLVLEKISDNQITYPVAFYWGFVDNPKDGSTPRTSNCTSTDITSFASAFCNKVSKAGYKTMFYTDKDMGYKFFNLDTLADYDIWYAEYKEKPSFYYDFAIWQFSEEGSVSGINGNVGMNLAMKSYSS